VVTDLAMPGMDGIGAIRELLSTPPEPAILVLTMHDDDDHVFAALRAGASGYLVKGADGAEILRAIASVAAGEGVYGAAIARRIVGFYAGQPEQSAADRAFPGLTRRERDVLELLAIGCRNHEIARRLGMSEKTVRNHVSQILLKLQVPDRTAAALAARAKGAGHPTVPTAPTRPAAPHRDRCRPDLIEGQGRDVASVRARPLRRGRGSRTAHHQPHR
jgi:DNA-binding NarL/FixJ family response regulator